MIRKLILLFSTIFISSYAFASDNIIEQIEINGLERIERETVISYSKLNINELYSNDIGNNALKELYNTDLFSDVKIEYKDGLLSIEVIENPTINLIKFSGNNKKNDDDLLSEIFLKDRSIYSRSKVKKDVNKILSLYQRSGRLSTEVIPKVETLSDNRVNLIFEINESDVVSVSRITFIGNNVFSSRELRKVMKTKASSFLRYFSASDNYDPDKLEYDKILISNLYRNSGYPNFSFKSSIAQLIPNKNQFEIIMTIDEGDLYSFGDVTIESKFKKLNDDFLANTLLAKKGNLYNAELIKDDISSIKDSASTYGYSFIKINSKKDFDDENKQVNINYLINEGPRVYINKIVINGNTRTTDKVIRRQLTIAEGDSYSKYLINLSKNKIQALQYFSKVNITEEKDQAFDKINLLIDVEEKNTGEATIGAGYSSATKANLQLGITEQNFLGKGQQLKFQSSFGDEFTTYDISFAEPYLNGRDLYIKTDLYSELQDSASVNYETEKLGFGLSLGFPLSYDKRIITKYSLFNDKTSADINATAYEKMLDGTTTVSSIGYSFSSDKRNSPYKPSAGYKYILNQDIAGIGGDSYFVKSTIEYTYYKRLNKSFVGSLKLNSGHLNGYNDKYAPISSYFNLGGSKLRGFTNQSVGPKAGNSYTGGQYFYLLSTETNIDLPIENFDITSTLFVDVGSVWGLDNRFGSIDDKHKLRSSLGINFIWDSAIGPINFVFAKPLQKQTTDKTDNFYFDIGYNF
ncbi:outer membrane protein assembly factor BamA [Pelagibacteraceae bacterium]|nr:outer membrane protein assembly factor BamA [Pelagibacteraceae bacterium]